MRTVCLLSKESQSRPGVALVFNKDKHVGIQVSMSNKAGTIQISTPCRKVNASQRSLFFMCVFRFCETCQTSSLNSKRSNKIKITLRLVDHNTPTLLLCLLCRTTLSLRLLFRISSTDHTDHAAVTKGCELAGLAWTFRTEDFVWMKTHKHDTLEHGLNTAESPESRPLLQSE